MRLGVFFAAALLGCSAAPSEDEVRSTLRSELDAAGLDWVEMEVENRAVRLGGLPPALGGGGLAIRTAEETMCRTALGIMPCATTVSADFGTSLADGEAWPRLEATVALGVLTLRGTVPDDASRLSARDAASEGIREERIERYVDGLVIEDVLPRPGSQALVKRLTRALTHCRDGGASIVGGDVKVACRLAPAEIIAVRVILASPLPAGELVELDLVEAVAGEGRSTVSR
ncbi:MAG: hypothetical protein KJO65_09045 [Gemmatimonadetes bacterium]|nr:hypothetical protein [Gemmatimonadota bacterium]